MHRNSRRARCDDSAYRLNEATVGIYVLMALVAFKVGKDRISHRRRKEKIKVASKNEA